MEQFKIGDLCIINPHYCNSRNSRNKDRFQRLLYHNAVLRIVAIRKYHHTCFYDTELRSGSMATSIEHDALIKYIN